MQYKSEHTLKKIILCECGCKAPTTWNKRKKEWNLRLRGHYKRTSEVRKKIGEKAKQHSHFHIYNKTKEHSEKVKQSNASRIVTEKTKNRISKSLIGNKRSKESCLNQSITMIDKGTSRGGNNSNWNGGNSPRKDIGEWVKISKEIKKRDNYKCTICKSPKNLDVHHIDFDENNHVPLNLITLCRKCHKRIHIER